MRAREHSISLWLDDKEYRHLKQQCDVNGLSASALICKLIMTDNIRPKPPEEYAALLRELSAIENNVNQIAHWANTQKSVSEDDILEASELARQAWRISYRFSFL